MGNPTNPLTVLAEVKAVLSELDPNVRSTNSRALDAETKKLLRSLRGKLDEECREVLGEEITSPSVVVQPDSTRADYAWAAKAVDNVLADGEANATQPPADVAKGK